MTTLQTVAWAVLGVLAIVALVAAVVWTEARAIDLTGERFHFDDDDAPRDDSDYAPDPYEVRRRLNGDH